MVVNYCTVISSEIHCPQMMECTCTTCMPAHKVEVKHSGTNMATPQFLLYTNHYYSRYVVNVESPILHNKKHNEYKHGAVKNI